jgi:hypothetical protein
MHFRSLLVASAVALASALNPVLAQTTGIYELVIYGIDADTYELLRYDFRTDTLKNLGVVVDQNGDVVEDVEGLAYVPTGSFKGLYGTANYEETEPSRLIRISPLDATAFVYPSTIGFGKIEGLVSVAGSSVATVDDFDIVDVEVVPAEPYSPQITILGSAVTWDFGAYDAAVGVRYNIGGDSFEPYGPLGSPTGSNVNDGTNPRVWTAPGTYAAGTPVSITARVWQLDESWSDPDVDSNWWTYRTITSTDDTEFLIVLRDGDPIPSYDPWQDQATIEDFVEGYIDTATDTIKLEPNQVILLFELAAADFMDPAVDFQDLVVLVTLAEDSTYFTPPFGGSTLLASARHSVEVDGSENYPGDEGHTLLTINPATGQGTALTIGTTQRYQGLAVAPDGTILGTTKLPAELWTIELNPTDVYDQTETLVGDIGHAKCEALEFAFGDFAAAVNATSTVPASWTTDGALFGFADDIQGLIIINPATGASVPYPSTFTSIDVEGLVFLTRRRDAYGMITVNAGD